MLADSYITKEKLKVHQLDKSTYQSYLDYQSLIKKSSKNTLYLAKNNNMILRYEALRKFNKAFKSIVIFRNPIDHAFSLLKQDLNFSKLQSKDAFVVEYMNWLGHHEFGLNHKEFELDTKSNSSSFERIDINYWLLIWINYYSHISKYVDHENFYLVDYFDLLQDPCGLLAQLGSSINMSFEKQVHNQFKSKKNNGNSIDADETLLQQANCIYSKLQEKKLLIE